MYYFFVNILKDCVNNNNLMLTKAFVFLFIPNHFRHDQRKDKRTNRKIKTNITLS